MCEKIYLEEKHCPVCNSDKKKLLGHPLMKDKVFNPFLSLLKTVEICKCENCNLLYLNPTVRFSNEFLRKLYPLEYWGDKKDKDFKNMKDKRQIIKNAIRLSGEKPTGKKLLDIGCGMGEFLRIANDFGMDPLGIDINSNATEYISSKYGYKTINGLIEEDTFEADSFDFVVLSHVIEHVLEPNHLVKIIHKILKPGGIFIMATPNAFSLLSVVYNIGKKLRHGLKYSFIITPFINPYHFLGFKTTAAQRLVENSNFQVLYNKTQPTFSWQESKYKIFFRMLKILAFLIGSGEQLVTISKK